MSQALGSSSSSSSAPRDYGTNGPPVPAVGFADFSPTEMYHLSESIAVNITAINTGWRSLDKALKVIGTSRDTPKLREQVHETQDAVRQSVGATTRSLHRLSEVVRRGDKLQKLQLERLTQTFAEAVTKYTALQKQLSDKMRMHMPKMAMTDFPTSSGQDDDDKAILVDQMQAQARVLEFESGMLEERESYMRRIEADVLDVNQIMRELWAMMHSQAAAVGSIEDNIERGSAQVEAGNEELMKAARYQAKFRRKMLILLVVAVVVGGLITAILVSTIKR